MSFMQGRSQPDLTFSRSSIIIPLADRSERKAMSRRTPLIVVSAVVLAFAAFVVIAGAVLATAFGSGNALATGPHPVTTPTRALVSSVAEINGLNAAPSALGQARIEVDATARDGDAGVFAGVGRAADVDRYLAGADVDLVTDLGVSPFRLTTKHQAGTAVVQAPGSQDFWMARAETRSGVARLSWPVQDGDYRVVLMNADGSPGLDLDGRFAVVLPSAYGISMTVLASGLGLALLGGVLLTLGLLAPRSVGRQPSSAGAAPPRVPAPTRAGPRPPVPTVSGSTSADAVMTATPQRSPR
jgi:hypothetical protein